jgi:Bacterial Ig-like domain/L,D-transpeptidase catalytic domain
MRRAGSAAGRGTGVFGAGRPGDQSDGKDSEGGDGSGGSAGKPASKPSSETGKTGRPSKRIIAVGAAAALIAAAGVTYGITQHSSGRAPTSAAVPPGQLARGPIHVVSITPASRSAAVDGAAPIVVNFSADVAGNSPRPQINPSVAGSWSTAGDSMVFTPEAAFSPSERVTVDVPAGPDGIRSMSGGLLTTEVTEHFTTAAYSQLALAELLAQQGYLPMTWSQMSNGAIRAESLYADPASLTPAGEAYDPPAGTFQWDQGYPASLRQMWSPDQANVILRGAVMAFEAQHNMAIDGSLTPKLWHALFRAQARGQQNQVGYTYAIASKQTPETLTIWHDGRVVEHALANTGIPVSPTVDGTFPVYERFLNTIMSGTNPDGSHYSDPVSFVSYFNGGDAVHYFPRGSYGFQQSLGCVELPYNSAQHAYPYLTYGSLVTVTS